MNEVNNLADLSLLYVEDEEEIREEMVSFLELRVGTLHVAQNGEEGWKLFQEFKPDIVISDINMPKMNGIAMSRLIKQYNRNVPIALITAFSDVSYMTEAITVGIDRYILKPVNLSNFNETIQGIAQNLLNAKIIEKAKKDKELIDTLDSFLEFSPNPIIIYEDSKVKYANSNFLVLSKIDKELLMGTEFDLSSLFQKRKGCISSLDELSLENKEKKVSIKSDIGRRILHILKDEIKIPSGNIFTMYTFNDITVNEYQKLKIEHYNLRLEGFVKHINTMHVKKHDKGLLSDASNSIKEEAKVIAHDKRELSSMEEQILKSSRKDKAYSASEYAKEIDDYVLEDIRELGQFEGEISEHLNMYEMDKDIESLFEIAGALLRYSSVLSQLFEFEDLSYSIKSLSDLLSGINDQTMDETKHRKTAIFLSALISDIMNWRMTIFVDQSAYDIHYLDASLFSTILQLELVINDKQAVVADADDDDFELF